MESNLPTPIPDVMDIDIEQYFTESEMDIMTEYEKVSLKEIKRHYLTMVSLGLSTCTPWFMVPKDDSQTSEIIYVDTRPSPEKILPHSKSGQTMFSQADRNSNELNTSVTIVEEQSSVSDDVKTGESLTTFTPQFEYWMHSTPTNDSQEPYEEESITSPAGYLTEEVIYPDVEETEIEGIGRILSPRKQKEKQTTLEDKKVQRPVRKLSIRSYVDMEVPDDDHFLYCEECGFEYDGECPYHSSLIIVEDKPVPNDGTDPHRAFNTLPDGLCIATGTGLGVWTTVPVCKGVRFGPYEGRVTTEKPPPEIAEYSWEILHDGKISHYVDSSDESRANWMKYIKSARFEEQGNLMAFQFKGDVFYRTICNIPANTELFVWYGAPTQNSLTSTTFERAEVDAKPSEDITAVADTGDLYCLECKLVYADKDLFLDHMKSMHGYTKPKRRKGKTAKVPGRNKTSTETSSLGSIGETEDERSSQATSSGNVDIFSSQEKDIENQAPDLDLLTSDKCSRYRCEVCGKAFRRADHLSRHEITHSGERPYLCPVCKKGFSQPCSIRNHLSTHNVPVEEPIRRGEKRFSCDFCSKSFSYSGTLRTHMRTHTGEKPYHCDICLKRFSQSSSMIIHRRIHTGERPCKCHLCSKDFNVSSNLTRHLRIHTGSKPYVCDTCGRRFNQSSSLKVHQNTHRGKICKLNRF